MAKAKDQLSKQVVKALKAKRDELQQQLLAIAEVLALYDPPAPLLRRDAIEQHKGKILELVGDQWISKGEIAKKTGIAKHVSTKAANLLVVDGKLVSETFHGVVHYRRPPQDLRLIVGEGELPKRRNPVRRSSKRIA
jgi:hypothetical protein